MTTDPRIEAAARALNTAGWTCCEGSDEPGQYDECEDCKRYCDTMARAALAAADKAATVTEANPRDLIDSLTDPDDCSFDHNNSCQAHGYYYLEIGEKCPNQQAKDWVATYDARGTE